MATTQSPPDPTGPIVKVKRMSLFDLPKELFEYILLFTSYEQIASIRGVNKEFNKTCGRLLNLGFSKVEKYHGTSIKKFKSKLPRRESERRSHPLARHCDVLSSVETRLSLLNMTYLKYMDNNLCCFIPGKVLDEIYRVLRVVNNSTTPPRVHELLQELRDISSMAMEYFEEKIAPKLKPRLNTRMALSVTAAPSKMSMGRFPSSARAVYAPVRQPGKESTEVNHLRECFTRYSKKQAKEMTEIKSKLKENEKQMKEMSQRMSEQDNSIRDLVNKLTAANTILAILRPETDPPKVDHVGATTRSRVKRVQPVEPSSIETRSKKRKVL